MDTIDEIEGKQDKESLSSQTGRDQVPSTTGPQSIVDPTATVRLFLSAKFILWEPLFLSLSLY